MDLGRLNGGFFSNLIFGSYCVLHDWNRCLFWCVNLGKKNKNKSFNKLGGKADLHLILNFILYLQYRHVRLDIALIVYHNVMYY